MNDQPTETSAITLVYSIDQYNVNPMLVSLSSALENNSESVQIIVLYTGKNQSYLSRLMKKVCGKTPYRVFDTSSDLSKVKQDAFPVGTIGDIAYLKFLVPEFVETPRAIFIDADTIVRADIKTLSEIDLQGKPIGAVQDWLVPTVLAGNSPIREYIRSEEDSPYFNSGVMLMDVEQLREFNLMHEASKLRDVKVRYVDQDLFNLIFLDNWARLDPAWNYPIDGTLLDESNRTLHDELWENRKISHYMGTKKPWIFPFNLKAINRDFTDSRKRSRLKNWIANPFSPSSLRYYLGFLRRKLGSEF